MTNKRKTLLHIDPKNIVVSENFNSRCDFGDIEELANQINKEVQRRKPIDLFEIGLKKGDILEFKENPSIKVTIEDSRHIKYEEEITSLSALAKKLKGFNHAVQGTLWFTYNGKLIDDIRTEKDIIND